MKNQNFGAKNWHEYIPMPIYDEHPEYNEFYMKAWELAYDHILDIPGMPQTPFMDEAFCKTVYWIWDSCFMSLFCKYAREVFPGVETLKNFYEVLHDGKHLATVIPPQGEPAWTKTKPGVPAESKIHFADNPPLFAWAEYENALFDGDIDYIKKLLYEHKFLQKHYEWVEGLHESILPNGVNYPTRLIAEKDGYKWEGGRSGMDNTPRGRKGENCEIDRPNNPDMLWIDAICQQALCAKCISRLYSLIKDEANSKIWNQKYLEKKEIINSLYWDEKDGFYYDIDCNTHDFYKIMTIASFWTMTSEAAPDDRAEMLTKQLFNPDTLGGDVPLISLSRSDGDYSENGKYWRGALWMPTAYATLKGMANYKMFDDARTLSLKALDHMYKTYKEFSPHTIWEAYAPKEHKPATGVLDNGDYVRPDFCGWSALGPISIYIEFVLGFHTVNAFENTVEWRKPDNIKENIGIKNLRFGDVITDIEATEDKCTVKSNKPYTLIINDIPYSIHDGINQLTLAQNAN